MDKRTGTNGSTSAREDENVVIHIAEASRSKEFDKGSIAIRTGLYQIEEGSGRKLAVLICSQEQRTLPNRPFFVRAEVLESGDSLILCPRCAKTHDTTSLMEALTDGWLEVTASNFDGDDGPDHVGFMIEPRILLSNEIRWLRDRNREAGVTVLARRLRKATA